MIISQIWYYGQRMVYIYIYVITIGENIGKMWLPLGYVSENRYIFNV